MRPGHARQHAGASLIEALIGFLVLSVGLLASTRWQLQLRQAVDLARQQAEALRLAQQDMEQLRAYVSAGPLATGGDQLSFEAIAGTTLDLPGAAGVNTRYRLVRALQPSPGPGLKALSVSVAWQDAQGQGHQLRLHSLIARQSPGLALSLAQAPSGTDGTPVWGRHLAIPREAADLGDGRSAFKPLGNGGLAWVLDNRSGQVLSQCDGIPPLTTSRQLTTSHLGRCTAATGLLLSGRVRFAGASPPLRPDPAQASDPPRDIALILVTSSTGHPGPPTCLGEAVRLVDIGTNAHPQVISVPITATPGSEGLTDWVDLGEPHWRYHCAVPPAPAVRGSTTGTARPHWSGELQFSSLGWTLGTVPGALRLCRYSADTDGSGSIDQAAENPLRQTGVTQALAEQNFLAIDGQQPCPSAPVDSGAEGMRPWTDHNPATVPHQP